MKILKHLIIGSVLVALSYLMLPESNQVSEELVLPAGGAVQRVAW